MISPENRVVVTRSLSQAFGTPEFEDIHELTGGPNSNPVFRLVLGGSAYLVRINTRRGDVARHYSCMQAAAEAGLAPHVWYTNVEDRLSITDFVKAVPFPAADALVRVPAVLRKLHALPAFPRVPDALNTSCMFLMNQGPALDAFSEKFRAANILPKAETEELFARREQLAPAYPYDHPDMVSSHNDLFKPDNMLFDGRRLWLVDWEAAFLNDRYADLAVVANMIVTNEAEERIYLQEYFGKAPDAYQLARLFLMRQLAHLFYAMGFFFMASQGKPIDLSEPLPDYADFHRRFWAGEIKLTDNEKKIAYGRIHWERLLRNIGQARYEEALRIVSDRSSCTAGTGPCLP